MKRQISNLIPILFCACNAANFTSSGADRPAAGREAQPLVVASQPPQATLVPSKVCSPSDYQPLRLVIVVDNTGSNNCTPGKPQMRENGFCGTDPVKPEPMHGFVDGYTDRQASIWQMITEFVASEEQFRAGNPNFVNSQIGLLSFPKGAAEEDLSLSVFHSGNGTVLPHLMTDTSQIRTDVESKSKLWDMLKFTHAPEGLTPYSTALKGAARLFQSDVKPDETRRNVILFITDGLPTDERPTEVKKLREALPNVTLIMLSLYELGRNTEEQNFPAKKTLLTLWNSERRWGHRPAESDGYADGEFEKYWTDLGKLRSEISNSMVAVEGSGKLQSKLQEALGLVRGCR